MCGLCSLQRCRRIVQTTSTALVWRRWKQPVRWAGINLSYWRGLWRKSLGCSYGNGKYMQDLISSVRTITQLKHVPHWQQGADYISYLGKLAAKEGVLLLLAAPCPLLQGLLTVDMGRNVADTSSGSFCCGTLLPLAPTPKWKLWPPEVLTPQMEIVLELGMSLKDVPLIWQKLWPTADFSCLIAPGVQSWRKSASFSFFTSTGIAGEGVKEVVDKLEHDWSGLVTLLPFRAESAPLPFMLSTSDGLMSLPEPPSTSRESSASEERKASSPT